MSSAQDDPMIVDDESGEQMSGSSGGAGAKRKNRQTRNNQHTVASRAAAIKFWDKRLTGVGKDALFAWYKKKFGLELNASMRKTWWHKRVELLQQTEDLSVDDVKATKRIIKAYGPINKLNDALFK